MKIISVVGARPNFIKIAPVHKAFQKYPEVKHLICHTGQHFDEKMSKVFFDELEMPKPDFYLGIRGGSHAGQVAKIMIEFEKVLIEEKPDLILVPGDVNSTMACTLVASKLGFPVGHIESGLRSFDRNMPEEINRMVTDILADYLFVSEKSGMVNLKKEGIDDNKIHFVGNVMIDSLRYYLPKIEISTILNSLNIPSQGYILATFHRPSNVDDAKKLRELVELLNRLAEIRKVVFPVHPRTKDNLSNVKDLPKLHANIILSEPIGYLDFLKLVKNAELVVTDSGGIQEETTYLNVQCVTVRDNTERPITVEVGTNQLIGTDFNEVFEASRKVLDGNKKQGAIPELWDGKTAERIVDILITKL